MKQMKHEGWSIVESYYLPCALYITCFTYIYTYALTLGFCRARKFYDVRVVKTPKQKHQINDWIN